MLGERGRRSEMCCRDDADECLATVLLTMTAEAERPGFSVLIPTGHVPGKECY